MSKKEYVLAYLHFMGVGDAHKLQLSPGRRIIAVLWHSRNGIPGIPKEELLCLIEIEKEPTDVPK